ncbi:phosphocarrier protein [Clostridium tetanomorphum]|uniref:Phosphocarrier protein HPr n=1 Tax=Clostridium tetanomorphum TaxID=1553 RepID=A0A923J296_CLOTT|nr:HPr family phosphocarrier protein [Clostridium tetanomorphum]KAJ53442.1 phosphotransferase system, phosphocarrier protein HPr [Clostridium tetanomorphum DSM 665]MBC2398485.1 HPr family phosphocarrier protein [Clostridium tetanomorphum]MBP1865329.1 phosphocarrier protein [Clostridium tetanomorphum]NRS85252.1 phosphocarrier protein [Clostridium tetanomorphum]NRZ98429.1 phosphocarrier protein [Clostridium tetanomorphum]
MIEKNIVIKNETGIHARPAMEIVKEASKFKSEVFIIKNNNNYNAKSIVGIMSMGCVKGDEIVIKASGEDEKEAVESLIDLIENKIN